MDDVSFQSALHALCPSGSQIGGIFSRMATYEGRLCVFGQPGKEAPISLLVSSSTALKSYSIIYNYISFSLHKELNDIFGIMLAYNLFSTATTLCCVVLYTILQGLNREGIGFLLFFISTSAQFYMVSYYGQLLIDVVNELKLNSTISLSNLVIFS